MIDKQSYFVELVQASQISNSTNQYDKKGQQSIQYAFLIFSTQYETTLLQLDQISRLPFAKSTFQSLDICYNSLKNRFKDVQSRIIADFLIGVYINQRKITYVFATQTERIITHENVQFYKITLIDKITFQTTTDFNISTTNSILQEQKFYKMCFCTLQNENIQRQENISSRISFLQNQFVFNRQNIKIFKPFDIPLLAHLFIGQLTQKGYFIKRIINNNYIDYYIPFDSSSQQQPQVITNLFNTIMQEGKQQIHHLQQQLIDTEQTHSNQFFEINEIFKDKNHYARNCSIVEEILPQFVLQTHRDNEIIQFIDILTSQFGNFTNININCDNQNLLETIQHMFRLVGFVICNNDIESQLIINCCQQSVIEPIKIEQQYNADQQKSAIKFHQPFALLNQTKKFIRDILKFQEYNKGQRHIYCTQYQIDVNAVVFYSNYQGINIGQLRIYLGSCLDSLQLVYFKSIFLDISSQVKYIQIDLKEIVYGVNFVIIDSSDLVADVMALGEFNNKVFDFYVNQQLSENETRLVPQSLEQRLTNTNVILPHVCALEEKFNGTILKQVKAQTTCFLQQLKQMEKIDLKVYQQIYPYELRQVANSFNVQQSPQQIAEALMQSRIQNHHLTKLTSQILVQQIILANKSTIPKSNIYNFNKYIQQEGISLAHNYNDYRIYFILSKNDLQYRYKNYNIGIKVLGQPENNIQGRILNDVCFQLVPHFQGSFQLEAKQLDGQLNIVYVQLGEEHQISFTGDFKYQFSSGIELINFQLQFATQIKQLIFTGFYELICIQNQQQTQLSHHSQKIIQLTFQEHTYQHSNQLVRQIKLKNSSMVKYIQFSGKYLGVKKVIFKIDKEKEKQKSIFHNDGPQLNQEYEDIEMYQFEVVVGGIYYINPGFQSTRFKIIEELNDYQNVIPDTITVFGETVNSVKK